VCLSHPPQPHQLPMNTMRRGSNRSLRCKCKVQSVRGHLQLLPTIIFYIALIEALINDVSKLQTPLCHVCDVVLRANMNVAKAAVSGGSSHRSSKLTLTPLTIPPPSATAHAGDRPLSSHSLETPGRPGSARLAPLRNPPQAPIVATEHAPNLPDVDRAPFVAQSFSARNDSDSDDDVTFAIDLKPVEPLLQPLLHSSPLSAHAAPPVLLHSATAGLPVAADLSSSGVKSALLPAPVYPGSVVSPQPKAAESLLLPAVQSPTPAPSTSTSTSTSTGTSTSALESGLSKRERQLLQLLSADEQGHLHSHALGSIPNAASFAGGSRSVATSNLNTPSSSIATAHIIVPSLGASSGGDSSGSGGNVAASSAAPTPSSSVISLSRRGSDAQSDGSWDDDESASGA
jgi:hypothetical protein